MDRDILLQEGQLPLVKLCDFGFSKDKFDDSEPQTQIGTALFTAPEIFTNVQGQVSGLAWRRRASTLLGEGGCRRRRAWTPC